MCSFWLVVLSLWLAGSARGVDVARCSNGTAYSLTLAESQDELAGRYTARLCSSVLPEYTHWRLELSVYPDQSKCDSYSGIFVHGDILARHEEEFAKDGNCSYVCLETHFDMVYSGCYGLQSTFITKGRLRQFKHKYEKIQNNYTYEDFKKNNNPAIHVTYHDEENATIEYHIGAPFKSFEVKICEINQTSANNSLQEGELSECRQVGSQCDARSAVEVRCEAALRARCHSFELLLRDDWSSGMFSDHGRSTYTNCRGVGVVPHGSGDVSAWRWACGVLVALLAALVLARAAARVLARLADQRARGKHVLRGWIDAVYSSEPSGGEGSGAVAARAPRHILLLYAREGPAGARVAAALRDLLLRPGGTQVYDIFSAEVMAQAARAPEEWARGMLQREDVSVLLLQTPALRALYHTHHPPHNTTEAPLLGRRVQYRVPAYGDHLLQYLLRYIADNVALHHNYRRLYIATLSELCTEMFPHVVPFRRYLLPAAGGALLHHLGELGGEPRDPDLAALAAAAREFVDTATDRPDYLMDEILLL